MLGPTDPTDEIRKATSDTSDIWFENKDDKHERFRLYIAQG